MTFGGFGIPNRVVAVFGILDDDIQEKTSMMFAHAGRKNRIVFGPTFEVGIVVVNFELFILGAVDAIEANVHAFCREVVFQETEGDVGGFLDFGRVADDDIFGCDEVGLELLVIFAAEVINALNTNHNEIVAVRIQGEGPGVLVFGFFGGGWRDKEDDGQDYNNSNRGDDKIVPFFGDEVMIHEYTP